MGLLSKLDDYSDTKETEDDVLYFLCSMASPLMFCIFLLISNHLTAGDSTWRRCEFVHTRLVVLLDALLFIATGVAVTWTSRPLSQRSSFILAAAVAGAACLLRYEPCAMLLLFVAGISMVMFEDLWTGLGDRQLDRHAASVAVSGLWTLSVFSIVGESNLEINVWAFFFFSCVCSPAVSLLSRLRPCESVSTVEGDGLTNLQQGMTSPPNELQGPTSPILEANAIYCIKDQAETSPILGTDTVNCLNEQEQTNCPKNPAQTSLVTGIDTLSCCLNDEAMASKVSDEYIMVDQNEFK